MRVIGHLETSRFIAISPFCSCESQGPERVQRPWKAELEPAPSPPAAAHGANCLLCKPICLSPPQLPFAKSKAWNSALCPDTIAWSLTMSTDPGLPQTRPLRYLSEFSNAYKGSSQSRCLENAIKLMGGWMDETAKGNK